MKLNKQKPKSLKDFADQGRAPKWAQTTEESQQNALKQSEAASARNRPPEFWLKDGDEKKVRIRQEGPIATIFRYSLKVRGNWRQFTAPADGDVDLFRDELGLTPTLRAVYEVIDIAGYTDKTGKKFRNMPRFFVANQGMFKQLAAIRKKRGPLNQFNIEIARAGEGTKTSYMFLPDAPSPMTPEMKEKPSLRADFAKYYAPLSEEEQRALVNQVSSGAHAVTDDE